jgi:hypothetical protein
MNLGGHHIDLMVDVGVEHSFVTQPVFPLSKRHVTIIKATGNQVGHPVALIIMARQCNFGSHELSHEFIYLHDCPVGLTGRDLLCKLKAQIAFDSDGTAA